jgi:hypothetical protein
MIEREKIIWVDWKDFILFYFILENNNVADFISMF